MFRRQDSDDIPVYYRITRKARTLLRGCNEMQSYCVPLCGASRGAESSHVGGETASFGPLYSWPAPTMHCKLRSVVECGQVLARKDKGQHSSDLEPLQWCIIMALALGSAPVLLCLARGCYPALIATLQSTAKGTKAGLPRDRVQAPERRSLEE